MRRPGKGDELRKRAYPLLAAVAGFVGNVEGRDFMHPDTVDVVVTDGFTGNVALKSLEGALRSLAKLVFAVLESTPEAQGRRRGRDARCLLDAADGVRPRRHRWRACCSASTGFTRDLARLVVGDARS